MPIKKLKTGSTEPNAYKQNETIDWLLFDKELGEDGSEASSLLSTNTFTTLFRSQSTIDTHLEEHNENILVSTGNAVMIEPTYYFDIFLKMRACLMKSYYVPMRT